MRRSGFAILGAVAMSLGCAASQRPHPTAPAPGAKAPPDAAATIAQEAVNGEVTMLVHLDRMRAFRFARQLVYLGAWNILAADVGVDAFDDVERTFIASHASHNGQVALLLQHTAPEDRVAAAIRALQQRWLVAHPGQYGVKPVPDSGDPYYVGLHSAEPGELRRALDKLVPTLPDLSRFPFPAAYRYLKNDFTHTDGPVLIAAPHPGLVVLLPPELAFAAFRLMEGGGLPAPAAREAMVFRAWEPSRSIQNGPPWSPDVHFAEAVFTFDMEGASTLDFQAVCESGKIAKEQAERMTAQVEEAQTISLGGAKLRLFDFIQFRADKSRVKMQTHLFPEDVEWLVGMTMKPL